MEEKIMSKKIIAIIVALCLVSVCLSAVTMVLTLKKPVPVEEADIQYVLYLGTNDKDTNQPVFAPEEAKETLKNILIQHFGGYTIQEANGGWIDDAGTEYQEYTLVIYLSDTKLEDVHAACDELIRVFNQSSILIQANKTTTEFYSSK